MALTPPRVSKLLIPQIQPACSPIATPKDPPLETQAKVNTIPINPNPGNWGKVWRSSHSKWLRAKIVLAMRVATQTEYSCCNCFCRNPLKINSSVLLIQKAISKIGKTRIAVCHNLTHLFLAGRSEFTGEDCCSCPSRCCGHKCSHPIEN